MVCLGKIINLPLACVTFMDQALPTGLDFRAVPFQLIEADDLARIGIGPSLGFPIALC